MKNDHVATSRPNSFDPLATKEMVIAIQKSGQRPTIKKETYSSWINYFQAIGADKDLPTIRYRTEFEEHDRQTLAGYLSRYHQAVVLDNPVFPMDIDIDFVLNRFFRSLIHEEVQARGFNIKAHVVAFKVWVTIPGKLERIRLEYFRTYPDRRPKELAASTELTDSEKVEQLKRTIDSAKMIGMKTETINKFEQEYLDIVSKLAGKLKAL